MAVRPQKVLRQAREFVDWLGALEQLPAAPPMSLQAAAGAIDRTWAVPALISAWNATLVGRELPTERSAIKRALVSVLRNSELNGTRSVRDLVQLLAAARQEDEVEMRSISSAWSGALEVQRDDEQFLYLGAIGSEMQTAADAYGLAALGIFSAASLLAEILDGSASPNELADIAPVLSRVPVTESTRDMWFGVYMRFAVLASIRRFALGQEAGDVSVLPREFYNQASFLSEGSLLRTVSATAEDIRRVLSPPFTQVATSAAESVITTYPLHESGPYYVTSVALVLDSIAPWILRQVFDLGLWEPAISRPFEEKIIAMLERHGFAAGAVRTSGYWETPTHSAATASLRHTLGRAETRLPGQIDVLAYRDDALFLIEAKSLAAFGRNISDGLSPADARAWRAGLQAKADWLLHLGLRPDLTLIVIEGVAYLSSTEIDEAISLVPFEFLDAVLTESADPLLDMPADS